jgi:hypothetical protein
MGTGKITTTNQGQINMTPLEVYNLLVDVQQDYAGMVRELNRHKKLTVDVDPWSLPLMHRLTKARRDLAMVAGVKDTGNPLKPVGE